MMLFSDKCSYSIYSEIDQMFLQITFLVFFSFSFYHKVYQFFVSFFLVKESLLPLYPGQALLEG